METMSIFSKVCPFYPGDLLLGPQELRLVSVWSSLVSVSVSVSVSELVLLDEFCLFCATALFMKKTTTLLSIKYGYVRITGEQRQREGEK